MVVLWAKAITLGIYLFSYLECCLEAGVYFYVAGNVMPRIWKPI
jgi:hypothetical protein